jgi:hypothetical protein
MMSVLSILSSVRFETAPARRAARRGARWVMIGVGLVLIALGVVIEFLPLPLHMPGAVILVLGLILVLRTSYSARRTFIRVQRRHPKMVFPLRRLLRREPEVMPVAWQQVLRTEKAILPRRWRFAGRTRRRVVRSRRKR